MSTHPSTQHPQPTVMRLEDILDGTVAANLDGEPLTPEELSDIRSFVERHLRSKDEQHLRSDNKHQEKKWQPPRNEGQPPRST